MIVDSPQLGADCRDEEWQERCLTVTLDQYYYNGRLIVRYGTCTVLYKHIDALSTLRMMLLVSITTTTTTTQFLF